MSLHEILRHPGLLAALGVASVVMLVASVLGVPFVLARLPPDYLTRSEPLGGEKKTVWRLLLRISKNLLGALFVVLGILMLVLPGQGLLTLFVGLLLVDFPGKRRVVRRVVASPRVLGIVNALRRRWNRPPLEI